MWLRISLPKQLLALSKAWWRDFLSRLSRSWCLSFFRSCYGSCYGFCWGSCWGLFILNLLVPTLFTLPCFILFIALFKFLRCYLRRGRVKFETRRIMRPLIWRWLKTSGVFCGAITVRSWLLFFILWGWLLHWFNYLRFFNLIRLLQKWISKIGNIFYILLLWFSLRDRLSGNGLFFRRLMLWWWFLLFLDLGFFWLWELRWDLLRDGERWDAWGAFGCCRNWALTFLKVVCIVFEFFRRSAALFSCLLRIILLATAPA